ncbi:TIGR02302 family protein [Monaibacterium marinum]|uniref:TIGR02302 family protein n=1 Tax=Pontivivens marinum TaxID=1690039 RepID=A0A2C9CR77_9RHOB|nr:DUF4175 family protein [Monaibacterium marinum]SOH94051.1 TIGR02302 family protein [Monaibacterium marinum]
MSQKPDPLHAFRGRLLRTRLVIAAERGARAFWPLSTLALILFAALRFGGLTWLSERIGLWPLGAVVLVLLAGLTVLGLRAFHWPHRGDAIARLDRATARNVLTTLSDTPAMPTDAAQMAVWQAHRARAEQAARDVAVPAPNLQVSRHDRYALRLMAAIAAVTALIFAQGSGLADLTRTTGSAQAAGPTFEAWATPPAYTGLGTLYLTERPLQDAPIELPRGTEIALRAYGDDFTLQQSVGDTGELRPVAPGLNDARLSLQRDGQISLQRGGVELASWTFSVTGDQAPSIAFNGEVTRGRAGITEIPFTIEDDFDVAAARVVIARDVDAVQRRHGLTATPLDRPDLAVDLPLPARGGASVTDVLSRDFSPHAFAGLPVSMVLEATDGAGQVARSEVRNLTLPQRAFYDPLARSIVEQRRDLLWAPQENIRRVEQLLRAVSYQPDDLVVPEGVTDALRDSIAAINAARDGTPTLDQIDELAEQLWAIALMIEDGELADAAAELRRAQQRLSQALQDGASDAEIAELMQDLREATRDYMRQLADALADDPDAQQRAQDQGDEGMSMSQQDLQDLMDRIQELSENGQREEAQRLLDQLAEMMENMQMTLNGEGQGEGGTPQPGGGEGGTPQEGVQDTLRQQQELADRAFEELQRQFRQGGSSQGEEGLEGLADTQEALRDLLDGGEQGDGNAEAQERLDEAERNMGDARDALERGDGRQALDSQAQAMDALREAIRELDSAETGENSSDAEGESASGSDQSSANLDPFGRPTENGSSVEGTEIVPEGGSIGTARDLLDEIRRRSGDRARTAEERDYLRRLLDRF